VPFNGVEDLISTARILWRLR